MKHCQTCACDADHLGVRVVKATVDRVGGCNFCNRNIGLRGFVDRTATVYELSGAGLLARLCETCAQSLIGQIGRVK